MAVDGYNLRLRFGVYKLKFLRSIVGFRSVVSQLFGYSFTKVVLFAIRWMVIIVSKTEMEEQRLHVYYYISGDIMYSAINVVCFVGRVEIQIEI